MAELNAASTIAPFAGLIGACVVAFTGYLVQRWRYRLDRLSVAIDHLCQEVNAAADLSSRYWLLDTSQRADAQSAAPLEPDLIGRQMRLQSLLLAISVHDQRISIQSAQTILDDLFDDLTGGTFKEVGRPADATKAQSAHTNAALINGALRSALAKRAKTWL